jgi:hypothetical protein
LGRFHTPFVLRLVFLARLNAGTCRLPLQCFRLPSAEKVDRLQRS